MNEKEEKVVTVKETRSVEVVAAVKIAATILKWIRSDQKKKYGLKKRHVTKITAPGIGLYNFDNGQYKIESPSQDETIITVEPFEPESGFWDGPSMTWDMTLFGGKTPRKDGLFEASLDHDHSFRLADEIAKANNTTADEVRLWANRVLELEMKYYAKIKSKPERRLVRAILDALGNRYSRVKKWLGKHFLALVAALAVGAAAGCAGCWPVFEGGDDGEVEADPIEWTEGR